MEERMILIYFKDYFEPPQHQEKIWKYVWI